MEVQQEDKVENITNIDRAYELLKEYSDPVMLKNVKDYIDKYNARQVIISYLDLSDYEFRVDPFYGSGYFSPQTFVLEPKGHNDNFTLVHHHSDDKCPVFKYSPVMDEMICIRDGDRVKINSIKEVKDFVMGKKYTML